MLVVPYCTQQTIQMLEDMLSSVTDIAVMVSSISTLDGMEHATDGMFRRP